MWNFIVCATSLLKLGFKYHIGRRDISLLYNNWLEDDLLSTKLPYVNIQDTALQHRDIYQDGIWHFEWLTMIIPQEVKQKLQSQILNVNMDDIVIWGNSQTGVYSSSSSFKWLCVDNPLPNTPFKNQPQVWKLKILEIVKHFFWLTLHGSLPTNIFRVFRHVSSVSLYNMCTNAQETVNHLLHDCNLSQ